jgi:hypothetical protein
MDMNLEWRKATYSSGNGGNCIEVATADRTVAVRDSKDPDGPRLAFGVRAWQAFATKLKGERSLASLNAVGLRAEAESVLVRDTHRTVRAFPAIQPRPPGVCSARR